MIRFFRRPIQIVDAATGRPPAPWGTSPVGSPLGQAEGTPLRYGGLGANPAVASTFLYELLAAEKDGE